MLPFAEIYR